MVLRPLPIGELKNFFDEKAIQILKFQLKKNILAQPEPVIGQEPIGIQIPKEYLEQWCVQAINAKPVGAGSYPVDIIKNNWGADIKSLACSLDKNGNLDKGDTGEASLAQKFTGAGEDLDSLFKNSLYDEIKDKWLDIVKNKNNLVKVEKNLDNLYYFIFLRGNHKYYLCGFEVLIDNLSEVTINYDKTTSSSVFLDNYIEPKYGYTKIYKAKKRLELRLKAKTLVEDNFCITLDIPDNLSAINLREIISLDKYFNEIINSIK